MRTIAVMNQMGGSGKTTSVINLAGELVRRGKKVLIVDLDMQGNATGILQHTHCPGATLADVICHRSATLADTICHTSIENLDLIQGGTLLSLVLTSMQEETFGKDTVLRRLLPQIPDTYEYVFFDCPPSPQNQMNINVLTAVQYVLIPFGMEHGVDNSRIPEAVQAVRESVNPGLQLLGLFLTAVETGSSRSRERIASFPTMVSEQVFKSFIRKSEDVRNAASALLPLCFYAPHCTAAGDYAALCDEMLERMDN